MPTKIKDNVDIQPIDFRYDEGIRGRTNTDISQTITTRNLSMVGIKQLDSLSLSHCDTIKENKNMNDLAIRKLTPLECLKLQGFSEEDYNAIKDKFSDSAIYHVAGDSISTTVEIAMFGSMTDIDYRKLINNYVETLKGDYE